jgi:hypothetical protein
VGERGVVHGYGGIWCDRGDAPERKGEQNQQVQISRARLSVVKTQTRR